VAYNIDSGGWSTKAPMLTPRRGFPVAADSAGSRLFAAGGIDCKSNCYGEDVQYLPVVEEYDAVADSWTALPPMRTPRRDAAAGFFGGKLYVTGGCNNNGGSSSTACYALASVEVYDPSARAWAEGPPMLTARHGHGVGICSGLGLLAFGGSSQPGIMNNPDPEPTSELLALSAASNADWKPAGNLSSPRYGLLKGFGLEVEGKVYAVGGSTLHPGRLNPSAVVEAFDCTGARERIAF